MNRNKLYTTALSFLGKDASPLNRAPQALACAESVNYVYEQAFGHEIGGELATSALYLAMTRSSELKRVDAPRTGTLVISPTGMVKTSNGHVGIMGDNGLVMSNNSDTGLWDTHLSLQVWIARYGFVAYFDCVEETVPADPQPVPPPTLNNTNPNRPATAQEISYFSAVVSWIGRQFARVWTSNQTKSKNLL